MSINYDDQVYNPLIPQKSIVFDNDGQEVVINKGNIMKYCRELYVLVPFHNVNYIELVTSQFTDDKLIPFTLYKCSNKILRNDSHFNNLLYNDYEIFKTANKFNYDLAGNIFIVPIFNVTFNNIKSYLDSFDEKDNLKEIYNMVILMKEFRSSNNFKNDIIIKNMIISLKESHYWSSFLNTKLNLTNEFSKRQFNIKMHNNITHNTEIKDFLKMLEKEQLDENYLEEIYKSKKYIDPSTIIHRNGFKLYYIEKDTEFSNEDIYNLFQELNQENKFLLFCHMLVSKRYCSLVINNEKILDLMHPFIHKYMQLFEYLFGYAWLKLYFEESIKKSYVKTSDSFVFTADTASLLPVFPLDIKNPQSNPYTPLMVADSVLQPTNNIGSMLIDWSKHNSRICNKFEFQVRFNIFCTNKMSNNLFQGIDFKENKMGITGSVMTACMQYEHPLLKIFTTPQNTSEEMLYNRYFAEYYSESDIDVMIKTTDTLEFMDISKKIYSSVAHNISLFNECSTKDNVKMKYIKQVYFFICKEFIMKNIDKFNNLPYEVIITQLSSEAIKKVLLPVIKDEHEKFYRKELEDFSDDEIKNLKTVYPEYFDFNEENIVIRLFDRKYKTTATKIHTNIDISEEDIQHSLDIMEHEDKQNSKFEFIDSECFVKFNIKCRVSSVFIDHELEIFPIKGDDFMGVVNQFHVPCVRAYFDGNTIHMSPSFITAHLTYMNINYKYVAGSKDPIEIINKYRMRGFGTWINHNETKIFMKYINKMPFWSNLYNVNTKNKNTFKNAIGFLSINHKLFRPRLYNSEYYESKNVKFILLEGDIYNNSYNMNFNIPNDYYNKRYNSINDSKEVLQPSLKYICNNSGYVKTLDRSIIDTFTNMYVLFDIKSKTNVKEPKQKTGSLKYGRKMGVSDFSDYEKDEETDEETDYETDYETDEE